MATILFYVSGALQTRIRSRSAIVDLQDDTTSYSSPVNDEDGTGEGGGEDDATSSSSSESVSNNRISQAFLQWVEGHYCSIRREQHYLTSTDLATFETEAQCAHVYCYVSLQSRKTASVNGDLTCPECMCIALNIIHHQPIRLDDGFPYQRNILQEVLGRSEGHFCSICYEYCKLRDTDLGTIDTTEQCTHAFCFNCLSTY